MFTQFYLITFISLPLVSVSCFPHEHTINHLDDLIPLTRSRRSIDLPPGCQQSLESDFHGFKQILYVDVQNLPRNQQEIDGLCSVSRTMYNKLRNYNRKCLKSLARQLFSIMLRGMRKQMKSICTDPGDQKKAIKIYGCTSETSIKAWNECFHSANRQFMFAAVNSTDRQLFPDLCCMYPRIERCVVTQMKPKASCRSEGDLDIAGFYRATVEISIKDTLDLACGNFATEEQCAKANPSGVKALTEAGESSEKVPEPFYLYPLLKVLSRLTDTR